MNYKLAQLILTPGKSATTTSEIFIAQPDAIKEELAGKLFLLIEIESNKTEALKLINFLVDNINYNYYQSEKVLLRERMPSLKIDHIFEGALAKTNKNFAEYLEREKLNFDPGKINVTAGIIHESSLYFANTGKNQVFLIYKVRPEIIKSKVKGRSVSMTAELNGTENEYKISNLTQPSAGASPVNETKLFSDVMSGKIPERSAFVIANEALPEYISSQQLVKIVSTIPPASAVEQIKNLLSSINSYVSFLGIIVKSATAEQPDEERPAAVKNAQSSITGLNQTEEITETLLAPSGMINPKKWLKLVLKYFFVILIIFIFAQVTKLLNNLVDFTNLHGGMDK
jgi:serine/threonine protein phosphatase PrpC